jgi:hypothetical protein
VRAREGAAIALKRARQQLQAFLLRHGRIYTGRTPWSKAHSGWLCDQKFDHPAHQIVLTENRHAVEDAQVRLERLTKLVADTVPSWSMAPLVQAYQAMRGISLCGRNRRRAAFRQSSPAHGLPRPGSFGKFDRRAGAARRNHQSGKQPGAAGTH